MQALDALGDPWASLIIQEAFFGVRRFDEFQENLGIARNTLTDRLVRLADYELLERRLYHKGSSRHEYRLTQRGLGVYPYALALMWWGDEWLSDKQEPLYTFSHKLCGRRLQPNVICAACKRKIYAEDVSVSLNSAKMATIKRATAMRYSSNPDLYTRGRLSSNGRTLALIGDRWGFLILWLALAGITKFDHFQRILSVSRTILTLRLERLVKSGLFKRRLYLKRPPRYDYHLTEKGRALCPVLLTLFEWGQRWLGVQAADENVMHKSCGAPLRVDVVCGNCREIVNPSDVLVSAAKQETISRWLVQRSKLGKPSKAARAAGSVPKRRAIVA